MVSANDEIHTALTEIIGAAAVAREELTPRLAARGYHFHPRMVDRELQLNTSFAELEAGFVYLPALTDGVAFAMLVDAADAAEGFVRMHPWLDAIGWWLIAAHPVLLDPAGAPLGPIDTDGLLLDGADTDVVLGPDGWLDNVAGGWAALRVSGGSVTLEPLTGPPPVDEARSQAISGAFERVAERHEHQPIGADEPIEIARSNFESVLLEAIHACPEAFRGVPVAGPGELLPPAGLRLDGHWVVPTGLAADVYAYANAELQTKYRYGVDAESAAGIQLLLRSMGMLAAGDPDALGATAEERELAPLLFAGLLGRGAIAQAIALACDWNGIHDAALAFATTIAELVGGIDEAWAPTWLAAHCHLVAGEVDRGAELLDQVPASAEMLPLVLDRARVATERSDARTAQSLVTRAEQLARQLTDGSWSHFRYRDAIDELREEIKVWVAEPPPPMARRNEPCPCGSGRKYKTCHLGRELHPIDRRAAWLHRKMIRFARSQNGAEVDALARAMADAMGMPEEWPELAAELPFLPDLVLREGGLAQRYLDGRLGTLPDDERHLAQQWLLVNCGVFEVKRNAGTELHLRDLLSGVALTVTNASGSFSDDGAVLLGRAFPVNGTYRAYAGLLPVFPDEADEAVELVEKGDPFDLVQFLGETHQTLFNRDVGGR